MEVTAIYHCNLPQGKPEANAYFWEKDNAIPFDELLVSWNALRPETGAFRVSVRVKTSQWSPWFQYALWGSGRQRGGGVSPICPFLQVKDDMIEVIRREQATGFAVCIEAIDGACLDEAYSLHACTTNLSEFSPEKAFSVPESIELDIPRISQMTLSHPRHRHLCSPASTSAAVSYLLKCRVDPLSFASLAYDEASDIFGNWALNTAQAFALLGKEWRCWSQRLNGFADVYARLRLGLPVIVSVRSPLPGSAEPYLQGHLVAVKGYCSKEQSVLCMDPAFSSEGSTDACYHISDFVQAWSRRNYIAYVFEPFKSFPLSTE